MPIEGDLSAQFRYPFAVTMDSAGSFALIADNANSVIRRVVVSSGAVTTLAGGAFQWAMLIESNLVIYAFPWEVRVPRHAYFSCSFDFRGGQRFAIQFSAWSSPQRYWVFRTSGG